MKAYSISKLAEHDLGDIYRYIESRNPNAAARLLKRFADNFLLLSQNPGIGVARHEIQFGLRCFPVGNYVIYFIPADEEAPSIEIVRVLHGARDEPHQF
ncbi:MAG: type II toxin-antitoxin system RelE/ParE family toxin [Planctomycetota bacterium]|nr:type II toxin-antitoxin system RelE/ParE family toxin [Planctomycetota bacterium]MDA0918345.1 type II toxin-antitoxin system RelE/ParE family toxin [Planctomycetota bacterium]MDA1158424.1 type II toxin-antitoxin system RelE/ParE family toxin [Planctomycetota bacterium]